MRVVAYPCSRRNAPVNDETKMRVRREIGQEAERDKLPVARQDLHKRGSVSQFQLLTCSLQGSREIDLFEPKFPASRPWPSWRFASQLQLASRTIGDIRRVPSFSLERISTRVQSAQSIPDARITTLSGACNFPRGSSKARCHHCKERTDVPTAGRLRHIIARVPHVAGLRCI